MLILTENQEQNLKRTISNKVHDILKGKIKSKRTWKIKTNGNKKDSCWM